MSATQRTMIFRAMKRFGSIQPCAHHSSFDTCFTEEDGKEIFWYNTSDGSTHVEILSDPKPNGTAQ